MDGGGIGLKELPNPSDYDNESDFMGACVPVEIDSGRDQDQAVAICLNTWRNRGKSFSNDSTIYRTKAFDVQTDGTLLAVASTAEVDRQGDIVYQDWDLKDYKKNPIVLFSHNQTLPIGTADVWVEDPDSTDPMKRRLMTHIKLAQEGTSPLINTIRKLVQQKILRAISVGFLPIAKDMRLDERGQPMGFHFRKNRLLEQSIVSVPANAQALSLMKSMDSDVRDYFLKYMGGSAVLRAGRPSLVGKDPRVVRMDLEKLRAGSKG